MYRMLDLLVITVKWSIVQSPGLTCHDGKMVRCTELFELLVTTVKWSIEQSSGLTCHDSEMARVTERRIYHS